MVLFRFAFWWIVAMLALGILSGLIAPALS